MVKINSITLVSKILEEKLDLRAINTTRDVHEFNATKIVTVLYRK